MNSEVEFIQGHWDGQHEVSTLHLSYLVQTLLPLHTIKWDTVKRHYDSIKADLDEKFKDDEDLHCLSTGSMAEGYSIPGFICKTDSGDHCVEILSDIDILTVMSKIVISTDENLSKLSPNAEQFKGRFEYITKSPGYVRICLLNPQSEGDDIFVTANGLCYLSSIKWTDKMFSILTARGHVDRQGPAITLTDQTLTPILKLKDRIPNDLVFALPCTPWPDVARDWRNRVKNSGWLSSDVVDSITSDGCHVVAVPSKMSDNPVVEWRLSFSASEGKLARLAVTDYQRQCFVYIKILHHQKTKPTGLLSSYMFKSVFLHCCEKLSVNIWRDNPGSCVLYILDTMLFCLKKRHIPTYFLPGNNLIRHFTDSDIEEATHVVENVRADPISPVLEFTDGKIFNRHSVLVPFRKMVTPLLEDMTAYKIHKDTEKSLQTGILQTALLCCMFLLLEKNDDYSATLMKGQEGLRHLVNLYERWLVPCLKPPSNNLMQFVNDVGLREKDLLRCLRFFEAAVSLSDEYPEFKGLQENLACFYHASSYIPELSQEAIDSYTRKADELFKAVYQCSHTPSINHIAFLVKQGKMKEAIEFSEQIIAHGDQGSLFQEVCVIFDLKEKNTLVEPLISHIETHGKITGDAVSFGFFYLAYLLSLTTDTMARVHDVIDKFEIYYKTSHNKDTLVLLNYAKNLANSSG